MKNLPGFFLLMLFAIGATTFLFAAQKKEARVTQVIKDVRVLGSNAAPRAAALNDNIIEGNAVRTGADSRAELTFTDETLTRIGANTVFSVGQGAKNFDLASGALLLAVPKQNGTIRVSVGAATAAVTGFTAAFEKGRVNKMIVFEGEGAVSFKNLPIQPCRIEGGQMIVWPVHPTRCPEVLTVDIAKLMRTAKLTQPPFRKLPAWSLDAIQTVIDRQSGNPPPGGFTDPFNQDAVDQKNSGKPFSPPRIPRPVESPPGRG
jgi:hypothetical protein